MIAIQMQQRTFAVWDIARHLRESPAFRHGEDVKCAKRAMQRIKNGENYNEAIKYN
jgi:hypothetical protein